MCIVTIAGLNVLRIINEPTAVITASVTFSPKNDSAVSFIFVKIKQRVLIVSVLRHYLRPNMLKPFPNSSSWVNSTLPWCSIAHMPTACCASVLHGALNFPQYLGYEKVSMLMWNMTSTILQPKKK